MEGEDPLIELPQRTDYVVNVTLTADEWALYTHMKANTKGFVKLMRMREGAHRAQVLGISGTDYRLQYRFTRTLF